MAMTVLVDALVFHVALARAKRSWKSTIPKLVYGASCHQLHSGNMAHSDPPLLLTNGRRYLASTTWPIFHTASSIVQCLPAQTAGAILNVLWETAENLVVGGVTRSHDLTGVVFQRLIADRKFLATYYTMPSGAALLAGLAIPLDRPLVGDDWSDAAALASARIGDFACGTGTLLSTAYQRIGLLHEIHGGNPKALHPTMIIVAW